MPLRWRAGLAATSHDKRYIPWTLLSYALISLCISIASGMSPAGVAEMRQETVKMFYHGFDNYMNVAFPEDELRPLSCVPLTRDSQNPRHVELNDVLGNYSLTLIDSLSTLAILASAPEDAVGTGPKALRDFQEGVAALVLQYGDGSQGPAGQGLRARGFDVDSKVQVFETVIRGVGGLLSAHLFASGELPINGYKPKAASSDHAKLLKGEIPAILWPTGFRYNGQLLRLALDLAQRLLPAFYTPTGLPYPRVNLRHGIPFYLKSPLHQAESSLPENVEAEITETCSAGAGSLVLEFTVLSRLTDDPRFEQLAKRAFWAVWNRRSSINLVGAGVDAESGQWIGPYAGIGAGTDSFFEYALKSHILLSGHTLPNMTVPLGPHEHGWHDPNTIHVPLSDSENSPEAFLEAWREAHAAIKRHLYSSNHHPHYVNVHLGTGSPQTYWIDSLGAYYPGLLTLAGEVEEAIETNLLYTALWTRYAALPERWSVRDRHVDGGLGWWPGRPEFIESTYHIYRATRDPWYLHVGEMVLKDIKRRCWTKCGWTGLQDVRTGERIDRMESFFLGETAKYMYLLFDQDHPLNKLDAAYVFTTEGHPLIIPKVSARGNGSRTSTVKGLQTKHNLSQRDTCPPAKSSIPFSVSVTAARNDIFHAASLIGLHTIQNIHASTIRKPKQSGTTELNDEAVLLPNHTYYPWTLPTSLIPTHGTCDRLPSQQTLTLDFPVTNPPTTRSGQQNFMISSTQNLLRYNDGVFVKSLSGLKMAMVYESNAPIYTRYGTLAESWRVWTLSNVPLGRDELVYISRQSIGDMSDPNFTRVRDPNTLELVLQLDNSPELNQTAGSSEEFYDSDDADTEEADLTRLNLEDRLASAGIGAEYKTMFSSLLQQVTSALRDPAATLLPSDPAPKEKPESFESVSLTAIASTGIGAFPIPDVNEAPDPNEGASPNPLLWRNIYVANQACTSKLPDKAAREHDVIIMRRGSCTFSEKLANIPSFTPGPNSLKLVVVVSDESEEAEAEGGGNLFQPLLDKVQKTPSGLLRHNQISMVMIAGGDDVWEALGRTRSIGLRRKYHIESQGVVVGNIIVV